MLHSRPIFLAGDPGIDNLSGALLHDKTWAVQTIPKVGLTALKPTYCCFEFALHLIWLQPFFLASENYGKSFQDVTSLINNTFIRSEFGIAIGPENSGKVSHIKFKSPPNVTPP